MRTLALMVISLAACGRIGFEPVAAGSGADASTSAPDAVPPFDAAPMFGSGPFGTPERVGEVSTDSNEDDPSLTGDMLELYFKSDRGGGTDIYKATRASVSEPFGEAILVAELNSASADDTPEVSLDGLTIMLASSRDGDVDIYQAARATRADAWSTPVRVAELSSAEQDYAAAMDGSKRHLVMTRSDGGDLNLFMADRASATDLWDAPALVAELASPEYQADAVLDDSGLQLYYTAIAPGDGINRDVYLAERSSTTEAFGPGLPVAEVNTQDLDEDPWISPDRTTLYFVREAPGGSKDLFQATRPLGP